MDYKNLFIIAREMMDNAYAPFSGYRVGAALLGADGRVYTGVNVENSSYGAAICAERTACVKAVSEGCTSFTAIAIATKDGDGFPCGICRQFLYEFAPDLVIILGTDEDHLRTYTLRELLPEGFRL